MLKPMRTDRSRRDHLGKTVCSAGCKMSTLNVDQMAGPKQAARREK
jgi:hypothetical protein